MLFIMLINISIMLGFHTAGKCFSLLQMGAKNASKPHLLPKWVVSIFVSLQIFSVEFPTATAYV